MRRIIRLLEPYNIRWSNWHGCWLGRVGLDQPWLDFYRCTNPRRPPDVIRSIRDDYPMEVLQTPVVDEPTNIYTRSRVQEWRERQREYRRTGDRGVIRITEAA